MPSLSTIADQQKTIKKKDYRSLVLYLMTLNLQSSASCAVLTMLVALKVNKILAGLVMVMVCLVFDIMLKIYYFLLYRKSSTETSPGFLKERKRMWMEGISLVKDVLCLVPVVGSSDKSILAISNMSLRFQESCHLITSMVLLVYFVISTYFMISQSFCYKYSVTSS